jgi:hypothetical protein
MGMRIAFAAVVDSASVAAQRTERVFLPSFPPQAFDDRVKGSRCRYSAKQ